MTERPILLDLFCCAGGAGAGYHAAGFDVIGVDIVPRPRYPHRFMQGDAIDVLHKVVATGRLGGYDVAAIHASPPCHDHTPYAPRWGTDGTGQLLQDTRQLLIEMNAAYGTPWVIENVPGAPMRADYVMCGCRVGLREIRRERWFETSWRGVDTVPRCMHRREPGEHVITVTGHTGGRSTRDGTIGRGMVADWRRAMGMPWATAAELAQAIPPRFTEYMGGLLMEQLRVTP